MTIRAFPRKRRRPALPLHDICANQLGDLEGVRDALLEWIRANPARIDRAI